VEDRHSCLSSRAGRQECLPSTENVWQAVAVLLLLIFAVSIVAGGVASIAGFGVGSLLTPVFEPSVGTKIAVAAVSIPHFFGTAIRFWRLREHVELHVLWSFGLTSAAGGLAGALIHTRAGSPALTIVFAVLLIFVGVSGLTGLSSRMRFRGPLAWIAGGVSGLFGGLVGNQGGIRSAALLGFNLARDAFVATATAIALFVDGARMPVYLFLDWRKLLPMWQQIAVATAGVAIGTVAGASGLRRIPERVFRLTVSVLVLALGVYMLGRGMRWW
jgi:uncharacterized membrane protein YfcA